MISRTSFQQFCRLLSDIFPLAFQTYLKADSTFDCSLQVLSNVGKMFQHVFESAFSKHFSDPFCFLIFSNSCFEGFLEWLLKRLLVFS